MDDCTRLASLIQNYNFRMRSSTLYRGPMDQNYLRAKSVVLPEILAFQHTLAQTGNNNLLPGNSWKASEIPSQKIRYAVASEDESVLLYTLRVEDYRLQATLEISCWNVLSVLISDIAFGCVERLDQIPDGDLLRLNAEEMYAVIRIVRDSL